MAEVGTWIVYVIMAFVVIGAIAAIRNPDRGLGREFIEGLHTIGPIFIPVAGTMATIPYLARFIESVIGPGLKSIGADPSIAAGLIATDMGGYQLAEATSISPASWIMASTLGFTLGCTLVFTIPVGLSMLPRRDHKYMALGILAGVITIPLSGFITMALLIVTQTALRPNIATTGEASWVFEMQWSELLLNLIPIVAVVTLIALGLRFLPNAMLTAFKWFGRILDIIIKVVLALSIVEYFTGLFTTVLGGWGFDPIIADEVDQFRALEVAGYCGLILAGAFPLVYVLRTYGQKPLGKVGKLFGVSTDVTAGILATCANVIALLRLIPAFAPKDKVLCIAFMVCGTDVLGGHLAYAANVQPTMLGPLLIGKFLAGVIAMLLAAWLALPTARRLEALDRENGVILDNEYLHAVDSVGSADTQYKHPVAD
ncbi:ethanolamine utilization protein EutH [Paramicrobacterium agarici]|uniref:Ethanolamine transporter n=1 Tax=Paramicrobacterium agarici TaxID=630514 RepID=A0A2A9DZ21_9MICO|nr:ethanolamine utilization protein EutH [Microbacterium agarici]PFG31179.1 ethanolamine transporter [Microbacterium agarici]